MSRSLIFLALVLLAGAAAASGPIHGTLQFGGQTVQLTDGFAMPFSLDDPTAVDIVATSLPIDRALIADDGVIDLHDVVALSEIPGNTVVHVSRLQSDFGMGPFAVYGALGRHSSIGEAKLKVFEPTRIAGRLEWAEGGQSAVLDFDAAVEGRVDVVLRGTPLPASGGEQGALLRAHLAALASGDLVSIQSRLHPEARKAFASMSDQARQRALASMQRTLPKDAQIVGGSVDGDWTRVNFDGLPGDKSFRGTAELLRVDGKWLVRRMRARS